jgi:hypothetical protein
LVRRTHDGLFIGVGSQCVMHCCTYRGLHHAVSIASKHPTVLAVSAMSLCSSIKPDRMACSMSCSGLIATVQVAQLNITCPSMLVLYNYFAYASLLCRQGWLLACLRATQYTCTLTLFFFFKPIVVPALAATRVLAMDRRGFAELRTCFLVAQPLLKTTYMAMF